MPDGEDKVFKLLRSLSNLKGTSGLNKLLFGKEDIDEFKTLFSSKYNKNGKIKDEFRASVLYLTSGQRGRTANANNSVLVPLDIELDIDGTGGIYPGNSFHSTYLPSNYKKNTVFQMFNVSHKVDSSGWTTSVTGKMRSTLNTIFKLGLDYKALESDIFTNYMNKVESTHLKQLEEQRIQREKESKLGQGGEQTAKGGARR